MIKPRCVHCGKELEQAGMIVLGSQLPNSDLVKKYYVCVDCEPKVMVHVMGTLSIPGKGE